MIDDSLGLADELESQMQSVIDNYECEWAGALGDPEKLKRFRSNAWVRVAGIVTHRQRPETASGVVFVTLEDEFGIVNLIIWSKMFDEFRTAVVRASLMQVRGRVQVEQGVIHVIAHEIEDQTALLGSLRTESRDFH